MSEERRRVVRVALPGRVAIKLLEPRMSATMGGVNISEGGVCLRVEEELAVGSAVRLQLSPEGTTGHPGKAVACTGRVAWVMQRLDLRAMPPFVFDVGIEFINPPAALRQLLVQPGSHPAAAKRRERPARVLDSWVVEECRFEPRLVRESDHATRWHLVVSVEGVPCFSGHYATERLALSAWARFKHEHAPKRGARSS